MSNKLVGELWDKKPPSPAKMLVLLAMADHADHWGQGSRASVGRLAWKTGLSRATVQRCIGELVDPTVGILVLTEARPGKPKVYRLRLDRMETKAPYYDPDKPEDDDETGGLTMLHPENGGPHHATPGGSTMQQVGASPCDPNQLSNQAINQSLKTKGKRAAPGSAKRADARLEQDKWPSIPVSDGWFLVPEPYASNAEFTEAFLPYVTRRMSGKKEKRPTNNAMALLFKMFGRYPIESTIYGVNAAEIGTWVGVPEGVLKEHADKNKRQNGVVQNDDDFEAEVQRKRDNGELF